MDGGRQRPHPHALLNSPQARRGSGRPARPAALLVTTGVLPVTARSLHVMAHTTRSSEQRLAASPFSCSRLASPASVTELEIVRPSRVLRMKKVLLLLLLSVWFCELPVIASDTLRLSVAITSDWRGPTVRCDRRNKNDHFHVILTNISDGPQHIWQDDNSLGWQNLRLELTDAEGHIVLVARPGRSWDLNSPTWWALTPQESHVFDIDFNDPLEWTGFPILKKRDESFTIRAIYEVDPVPQSTDVRIWTGKVISEPVHVLLLKCD